MPLTAKAVYDVCLHALVMCSWRSLWCGMSLAGPRDTVHVRRGRSRLWLASVLRLPASTFTLPCIHAQTIQRCQHPHAASNLSYLTWSGQQSATLCLCIKDSKACDFTFEGTGSGSSANRDLDAKHLQHERHWHAKAVPQQLVGLLAGTMCAQLRIRWAS
jgi:hypothetical protein